MGMRGLFGLAVGAGFVAGLATVGQALALSRIIHGVFLEGQGLSEARGLVAALVGLAAARAALGYGVESWAGLAAARVKDHLRRRLLDHLTSLGPAALAGERSGEITHTIVQGVEALDAYFSQYLPQLILAGLLPVAYLVVIFPIDPLSGAALLLTGPLIPLFLSLIGAQSQRLTRRQFAALGQMSAYFLDTLQGLAVLKALGRSREQVGRIAAVSEHYRATALRALRLTFLSALALELLSTMGTAVVAVQVGLRLLYGGIAFEPAFFVLLMAPEFYLPLRNLGLRFHASMAGVSAARRIFEVLDDDGRRDGKPARRPASADGGGGARVDLTRPFEIRLEDVHYTYPARGGDRAGPETAALRGVSLCLRSGERVALVGASGAGKSTLAALLMGWIWPERGAVWVNGVRLEEINPACWRAQIAYAPQRPYLFHDTIAANLRLGRPGATEDDLRRAAEAMGLAEWIAGLPRGYDTVIGEGGARLAGGQAQRLALARALLRDAPLLVLDEPAAHLDVEQEELLQAALERVCAGRTALVIAHRLRSALRADRLIVLAEGRVVEEGEPAALWAGGGAFTRLARAARGEEEA